MFFKGSFFGLDIMTAGATQRQDPISLTDIILGGNQTARLTRVLNRELTEEEIMNLPTDPVYDRTTQMLARYNDNLNAGNAISDENIITWRVQRLNLDTNVLEFIADVPVTTTSLQDFTASREDRYRYEIFGKTQNTFTRPAISSEFTPNAYGWFLIGLDSKTTMWFDIEINSGTLQNNVDHTVFDTFGRYGTTNRGRRNYYQGTVQMYAGVCSDRTVDFSKSYLNSVIEFLNNGEQKIMKDRKGRIYLVDTFQANIDYYDEIGGQPSIVSWNFVEVGEVLARTGN